ncbi:2-succinyl-5-enolpyruvyl-6-hydroxy-3-cyclohexene-1-carboxylic-acid synthase [Lutimonas sp.]|uniref:2-succinyl-5-enolpyruvyl-6-hydroxy-3- cyclohexene-1-carboxylic-acid synthase n=1 Tax=Lutimonas sp. TaxID=1872403 RepID=UPI003D9B9F25
MPKYPEKKIAQLLLQSCVAQGIKKVVISPGSRNAPLTLGIVNHPDIHAFSIVDERCAAFFALGMAQQSKKPVVLLCTSGSALLNYYPAIAEAFYSNIPLVVISADRPKHLIDIGDGQTIRQEGVFINHILSEVNLPSEAEYASKDDLEKDLVGFAKDLRILLETAKFHMGPVHINIAFDEPLYETVPGLYDFGSLIEVGERRLEDSLMDEKPLDVASLEVFADKWNASKRKMVIIGSNYPDELLSVQMRHLIKDPSVIVLTETSSNISDEGFINCIDQLIFPLEEEEFEALKPDILLSFGGMVVSKRIKQLLRKKQPMEHWHVDRYTSMDTYHCLTKHFSVSPQLFFSQFFFLTKNTDSNYQKKWLDLKEDRKRAHQKYLAQIQYSDMKVFDLILESLPVPSQIQFANSSIIRYSQLFDLKKDLSVFCNRGTSGIDGSTSTAIGAALENKEQTVLISGDISFFYDSNALWNKYIPKNFRIILVNNSGGGIFRIIPGPKSSDALEFFDTPHNLQAADLCKMHGFNYLSAKNLNELSAGLANFYAPSERPVLLELFTPPEINDEVLKNYFKSLA